MSFRIVGTRTLLSHHIVGTFYVTHNILRSRYILLPELPVLRDGRDT